MTVYCIRSECGAVKIGVAKNVQRRLENLQIGSPSKLELVGVLPGGEDVERDLHARFSGQRRRGEWFEDVDKSVSSIFAPFLPRRKAQARDGLLADFLFSANLTQTEFAARVGTKKSHLSGIVSGKRRPGLSLATRIEKETRGAVPIVSWASQPPGGAA